MEDNIWDLFEILVSIYEGFNLYYYIFTFLDYNFRSQRSKIVYSAGAIIHTCIVLILKEILLLQELHHVYKMENVSIVKILVWDLV